MTLLNDRFSLIPCQPIVSITSGCSNDLQVDLISLFGTKSQFQETRCNDISKAGLKEQGLGVSTFLCREENSHVETMCDYSHSDEEQLQLLVPLF